LDCLIPKLVEEWVDRPDISEVVYSAKSEQKEEYLRLGISEEEAERRAERAFDIYVKPVIGTYLVWLKRYLAWGYDKDRAERKAWDSILTLLHMLSIGLEDEEMKGLYHYLKNILRLGTQNSIQAP